MSATPAIDRALVDIDDLEEQDYFSEEMARRAREAVGLLFNADTVYASISPIDGDDVSFYWKAGDRSVSIELGEDGHDWAAVCFGTDQLLTYDGVVPELRNRLSEFSAYVEAVNPKWREMPR